MVAKIAINITFWIFAPKTTNIFELSLDTADLDPFYSIPFNFCHWYRRWFSSSSVWAKYVHFPFWPIFLGSSRVEGICDEGDELKSSTRLLPKGPLWCRSYIFISVLVHLWCIAQEERLKLMKLNSTLCNVLFEKWNFFLFFSELNSFEFSRQKSTLVSTWHDSTFTL